MEGAAQQQPQRAPNQQMQNLIRPEQVQRLPHLTQDQKNNTEQKVRKLWEFINANSSDPTQAHYQQAYKSLAGMSATLMQGMKMFNQQRQRERQAQQVMQNQGNAQVQNQAQVPNAQQPQSQAQQPQINGVVQQQQTQQQQAPQQQQSQAPTQATNSAIQFSQLSPDVQARVNAHHFHFPPAMQEGSEHAKTWLTEAKARFGQAIQRMSMARSKRADLVQQVQKRTAAGNPLTAEENAGFQAKVAQCDKAMRESQNFMTKFNEQQEQFKAARPQNKFTQPANPALQPTSTDTQGDAQMTNAPALQQTPTQGPQAHSIATAQAAARAHAQNQAQSAGSPTAPAAATAQPTPTSTQPTTDPTQTPFNAQSALTNLPQPISRPPTSAGPHATPSTLHASHAHPPANPLNTNNVNGMKTLAPPIPKTLNVSEAKPVPMPTARPTLNGGAGVGMSGQMGQPALTVFPGYVLEQSEDGHLLSRKKLTELVREVLGPNSEEQLTPEAEEICLHLIDDFIDDIISAGCRLAKLRGATSLEARDVQVILERQYNIRIPGFSTDEVRTVKKVVPTAGWTTKIAAVGGAKELKRD